MSKRCAICVHDQRAAIDKELVAGVASMRELAQKYSASPHSLDRHRKAHLPQRLSKATAARESAEAGSLLEQVKDLQSRAMTILQRAEDAGDLRTALTAVREVRGLLELLGKVSGEFVEQARIQVETVPGPVVFIPPESDD